MPKSTQNRRWYDQQADVSTFVTAILVFPEKIQTILCEGIMDTAEREFRIKELMDNVRSLGPDKLKRLLLSQNKRRNYDQTAILHRALTVFGLMPDGGRTELMTTANELVDVTVEYLGLCRTFKQNPTLEEIANVSRVYLEDGRVEVDQFLKKVQNVWIQKDRADAAKKQPIQLTPKATPVDESKTQSVVIDEDMRIRPQESKP